MSDELHDERSPNLLAGRGDLEETGCGGAHNKGGHLSPNSFSDSTGPHSSGATVDVEPIGNGGRDLRY
jgi:hypothetical protein